MLTPSWSAGSVSLGRNAYPGQRDASKMDFITVVYAVGTFIVQNLTRGILIRAATRFCARGPEGDGFACLRGVI
jgi:hypothetical protein